MQSFAEAARLHARQRHQRELGFDHQSIRVVDQILDNERESGDPEDFHSIGLCYGSWLGELAKRHFSASWTGMHEPHPPRLRVAGLLCSPIDAVLGRLRNDRFPPLVARWEEMNQWHEEFRAAAVDATSHNGEAWDELATDPRFAAGVERNGPRLDAEAARAALDPWLAELPLPGTRLLCLAAGGGTHSLIHAEAGFQVTVVDVSPRMLAIDREIAARRQLPIKAVLASMDHLATLGDSSFDAVLQPVSTCYVADVVSVYREVARVLRVGGLYVVQHKQPASMQSSGVADRDGYRILHQSRPGQPIRGGAEDPHLERGAVEFLHPLGELLGGLCHSGFVIEDFQEPPRGDAWAASGSAAHRASFLPPYLKIKARRVTS